MRFGLRPHFKSVLKSASFSSGGGPSLLSNQSSQADCRSVLSAPISAVALSAHTKAPCIALCAPMIIHFHHRWSVSNFGTKRPISSKDTTTSSRSSKRTNLRLLDESVLFLVMFVPLRQKY